MSGEVDSTPIPTTLETAELNDELKIFDFSHFPLPNRSNKTMRIFYNNVNGLEINQMIATKIQNSKQKQTQQYLGEIESHSKIEALIQQMYIWEVNVTALVEPCVEWRDRLPRETIRDIEKKYDRYGHWTVATSRISVGSFVKPGGALLYNDGSWSGRIKQAGTDPWGYGRWTYKEYSGKGSRSVLVISGYRVGSKIHKAGPTTAWYQQKIMLSQDKQIPDPADAFIEDLEKWLSQRQHPNREIIILLDANEQWRPKAQIYKFAQRLNLCNLNTDGGYNFPATHPCLHNPSRNTTIDYCLCTSNVLSCVEYATMVPYELSSLGDHRGLLLDIDIHKLCQLNIEKEKQEIGRKLMTNNPQSVKTYLDLVEEYFEKQRIIARVNNMYNQWKKKQKGKWDTHRDYEKLDREIFYICRKAERRCRTTKSGTRPWSPRLATAIHTLAYWRARKKYSFSNELITKLGIKAGVEFEELSDREIDMKIQDSCHELQTVKKEAIEHRQAHLDALAENYAAENNMTKSNAIQELIMHESSRHTFSLLREKLRPKRSGQIDKVWIAVDDNGSFVKDQERKKTVDTKEELHLQLLRRNREHLAQAKDTPFANGRFRQDLKWDGTGKLGRDILSGDILKKEIFSRTIQLYFESLKVDKMSQDLNIVHPRISLEEYYNFWKKKERTP